MNKKALAAEQMKQCIVDKTIEIYGSSGPSAFTASRLSMETGASKGALYHHFENLDDVKLASFQHLVDTFLLTGEGNEHAYPSMEAYLQDVGEGFFHLMESEPVKVRALIAFTQQAVFEPAFRDKIRVLFKRTILEYEMALSTLFPDLTKQQCSSAVHIVDAFVGGSMLHWFLLGSPEQCRDNWKHFSKVFCRGLEQEAS